MIAHGGQKILSARPKRIVLSGPSGFLGSRVLDSILAGHAYRKEENLPPGEVVLMSSSPGNLMRRLKRRYGRETMATIRASRVDYYTQHSASTWRDQLGSLGLRGDDCVFVNLAGVAGPKDGRLDALMDVNYHAVVAASEAAEELGFGHWVQSSTQATNAERAGQVPYARAKAMADFALSNMTRLPASIVLLGLLYSKDDGLIGQQGSDLNLADLSTFPLTPIMGSGSAPLQPLEVTDAAERLAYLALTEPSERPIQSFAHTKGNVSHTRTYTLRIYDAVGPEKMSMLEMLYAFSRTHSPGKTFRPVSIDYRNMERMLNVQSLGNMNRQFVSLLRSEQDANFPAIGESAVWEKLLGPDAKLITLDNAFDPAKGGQVPSRNFPLWQMVKWTYR
ncbi:unnamed protein product, partial [Ectocarpus fasciculatus]